MYLHYVFDLWVRQWRKRHARGEVIIVRFADDITAGFQYREDAERFLEELRERFRRFHLELHPDKTRLIEFGRYAAENRKRRGAGKPESFDFLGFTHTCDTTRSTPAENCTFMAGENCTPDDWVTNPKTPAPPGISCER